MRQRRHHSGWRGVLERLQEAVATALEYALLPFRTVYEWTSDAGYHALHAINQLFKFRWIGGLGRLLYAPFYELGRFSRWFIGWMADWWPNVRFHHLLQGLPALIMGVAMMVALLKPGSFAKNESDEEGENNPGGIARMLVPLLSSGGSKDALKYEEAAIRAFEAKKFDEAEIYYRALVQVVPDSDKYRFGLARTFEAQSRVDMASAIMAKLAPRDAKGYAPAHFWQALNLIRIPDMAAREAAEAHLLRAKETASGPATEVHSLLGQIYLSTARLDMAEKEFRAAADSKPELWIALARVHVLQDKRGEAKRDAEKAREHFDRALAKDLDNTEARLFLAESLLFLERFDDAADALQTGRKVSTEPRYSSALGRVYFTWEQALNRLGHSQPGDQQRLLVASFQFDPGNRLLLRRLIQGLKGNADEAAMVRGVLKALPEEPRTSALVELLRAIETDMRGQSSAAAASLKKAGETNPKLPAILSEVAKSFVELQPINNRQALELITLGLRVWPKDADLNACRGWIHVRDGKWLAASGDLQTAAASRPEDPWINRLLGEVNRRLGMGDRNIPRIPPAKDPNKKL